MAILKPSTQTDNVSRKFEDKESAILNKIHADVIKYVC